MDFTTLFPKIETEVLPEPNIDLLREKLDATEYRYEKVAPTSIKLEDDGKLTHSNGSNQITMDGIKHLVTRVFRIPDPFSRRIPFDLLQQNISRLSETVDDQITLIFKDDLIINGIMGDIAPISTQDLLSAFREQEVNRIELSDRAVNIQTLSPTTFEVEPKPGHVTHAGVNFINSATGFMDPRAESLLFTLVCSNGMILPRKYGQAKIKIRGTDIDPQSVSHTFRNKLNNILRGSNQLAERFNSMKEIELNYKRLDSLIRTVTKYTEPEVAMTTFSIDDDERVEIKNRARSIDEQYENSGKNLYDIHYEVTSLANNYKGDVRRRLQKLGGKMFDFDEVL